MKVLLVNQFFPPDLAPTGQMAADLGEELEARGHQISALTGQVPYEGGARRPRTGEHHGIALHRVPTTAFGRRTVLHRLADYGSFYVTAAAELLRLDRPDVVICMTSPPLVAALGPLAQRARGARFVYWVQDLYPEVAIALGVMRPGGAPARAAALASRRIFAAADRTVVLGEAMAARVERAGAAPRSVRIIPNWIDDEVVRPLPHPENPLRRALSRGRSCLVMYSGNIGRGHDVETLLAAADRLKDRPGLGFVFVGDGAQRGLVERASRTLPNVWRAPYAPREKLAQSLSAADIHVVSLAAELEGLLEPSKLYGAMAAGRPVVFVGPARSEVSRTLAEHRFGVRVPNGEVGLLCEAIDGLFADPDRREEWGARARAALVARHSRRRAGERWAALLAEL